MPDPVHAEVLLLRDDVGAQSQGLMLLNETCGATNEMVRDLLDALRGEPAGGESPTEAALGRLTAAVDRLGGEVSAMRLALTDALLQGTARASGPAC